MSHFLTRLSTKRGRYICCLVGVLLAISYIDSVQAAVLPPEACIVSSAVFRIAGCVNKDDPFCRLLAFQLLFNLGDEPLCIERPCSGYGLAETHECKPLMDCPIPRIHLPGVCNGLDICCRKSGVDPSVDANSLDDVNKMFEGLSRFTKK